MERKKRILLINVTVNWGSTGKIAEQIGILAQQYRWDCYIAYGRYSNPSRLSTIKIGNRIDVIYHYALHRLIDMDGLCSSTPTNYLVEKIKEIHPDIIHLHNIHDHWLNYVALFEYLNELDIPIIWTQHDCWCFTGGCSHYAANNCSKWQKECSDCMLKKGILPLIDQTKKHFYNKKRLFNSIRNLTLVPVSLWLEGEIRNSFLKNKRIVTIYNGVDTTVFRPVKTNIKQRLGIEGKALLVAVATKWVERKGLNDYIKMAGMMSSDVVVLLVGLSHSQMQSLPVNIIGLERTQNVEELVRIYSGADIVMNLSYEESFGLTTVEGFACGTPSIVYNTTASPELITPETGIVVEKGNIKEVINSVKKILATGKQKYSLCCRKRAIAMFDKNDRFNDYIQLYEKLLFDNRMKTR